MLKLTHFITGLLCVLFLEGSVTGDSPPKASKEERITIADGVTYIHSYFSKSRWSVHVLLIDLEKQNIRPLVVKGLGNIAGLERVGDIIRRADSINPKAEVIAGVNSNFWKAGTNHPMGPTVSNGEILKARKYKNWSSVAFTESGSVLIDTFDISTALRTKYGDITIDRYNLRVDNLSVVVYSRYFGTSVPFIDTLGIMEASEDSITDDSEVENVVSMAIDSLWGSIPEAGTLKMQFEYIGSPKVNTFTTCRVTDIDTGIVAIPKNGGIISFGRGSFPLFFSLFVGDTFSIVSKVTPVVREPILQMTGGTPRLVRNGKVSVEWREEGLRKQRFVTGKYGRTSMGVNKDGTQLVIITVEPYRRRASQRTRGISLIDLATLHLKYGAWNAMNFDGGGSTTMVVDGKTVSHNGNPATRKISTALLISKDKIIPAMVPSHEARGSK